MRREDFMFTIGYQGETAIIDKKARKKYGSLSTAELVAEGLYKPAFCSAVYNQSEEEMSLVLAAFNKTSGQVYSSVQEIKRLLGVFEVPESVSKVTYI